MSNHDDQPAKCRILVVEDDLDHLNKITKILKKRTPHQIDKAFDGQDAFEKYSNQLYDLIITDLKMPRMDGEHLIQEIRKEDHNIDLIVLTGHGELSDAYMMLEKYQISDFLHKPLEHPKILLFSVRNALEKQRLRQHLEESNEHLGQKIAMRQVVEESLEESRQTFLALVSHLPGMAYRRYNDEQYSIDFASEGCLHLTGYPVEKLISEHNVSYMQLIHPDDQLMVKSRIETALRKKKAFRVIYRLITAKGEEKWVQEQGSGIFSSDEELTLIEGFITDITAQKQAEEQLEKYTGELEKLNSNKDKFFSIVSHDLRTPLIGLLGFSEMLAKKVDQYPPEKIKNYVNKIHSSAKRLHNLLENMLRWAKMQTGRNPYQPTTIDLYQMVIVNISLFEENAAEKNIRLYSEVKPGTVVYADKDMIDSVIRNLISNAIKFTKDGKVKVSSDNKEGTVEISVSDTGVGMDQDTLNQLFRFDVPHTTRGTSNESGTGLGLILCKELIEKNGGQLLVESQQNEGSTFRFVLPQAPDNNEFIPSFL